MGKHRRVSSGRPERRTAVVAAAAAVAVVTWAVWSLTSATGPDPAAPEAATAAATSALTPSPGASSPPPTVVQSSAAKKPSPRGETVQPEPATPVATPTPSSGPSPEPRPASPAPDRERRRPRPEPSPRPPTVLAGYTVSQVWESGFQSSSAWRINGAAPVVLVLVFPDGVALSAAGCWWDVCAVGQHHHLGHPRRCRPAPGSSSASRRPESGPAPFEPLRYGQRQCVTASESQGRDGKTWRPSGSRCRVR